MFAQDPPASPLPSKNPAQRRREIQSKYATLPAKRSNALTTMPANKRARQPPREWELSKDRFSEQDQETLEWCKKYRIDVRALATGTQKRPPLPSFADIQRYDVPPITYKANGFRPSVMMLRSLSGREFDISRLRQGKHPR